MFSSGRPDRPAMRSRWITQQGYNLAHWTESGMTRIAAVSMTRRASARRGSAHSELGRTVIDQRRLGSRNYPIALEENVKGSSPMPRSRCPRKKAKPPRRTGLRFALVAPVNLRASRCTRVDSANRRASRAPIRGIVRSSSSSPDLAAHRRSSYWRRAIRAFLRMLAGAMEWDLCTTFRRA
jgi:hypothetical protein